MKLNDPDKGCQTGEKNCAYCGKRGPANMIGDKPNAPLQFLRIKDERTAAWMCKKCRGTRSE
jgi:hypothetical protein